MDVAFSKEKEEVFYDLPMDIKGSGTLEKSLDRCAGRAKVSQARLQFNHSCKYSSTSEHACANGSISIFYSIGFVCYLLSSTFDSGTHLLRFANGTFGFLVMVLLVGITEREGGGEDKGRKTGAH